LAADATSTHFESTSIKMYQYDRTLHGYSYILNNSSEMGNTFSSGAWIPEFGK
jgi:hypothetical protein